MKVLLCFLITYCMATSASPSRKRVSIKNKVNDAAAESNSIDGSTFLATIERLRQGDPEAWDEDGNVVVDLVNGMIENGEARTPVEALLYIFWPNLSDQQRHRALERVEPLVEHLYNGAWANRPVAGHNA